MLDKKRPVWSVYVTTHIQNPDETLIPSEAETEAEQCEEIIPENAEPLSTQAATESRLYALKNQTPREIAKEQKEDEILQSLLKLVQP